MLLRMIQRWSMSAEVAGALIDAAERRARELETAIVTVVVDESAVPKAMRRMDGAPLVALDAAMKKARTAVGFGLATGEPWYELMKDDPLLLHGAPSLADFILLPGGLPIVAGGSLVGALGVSGAHHSVDLECARAALAVLEP